MLHIKATRDCKLKQQWETTAHLLEMQRFRLPTVPNTVEEMEQQELSFPAGENGTATLEDTREISYRHLEYYHNDETHVTVRWGHLD